MNWNRSGYQNKFSKQQMMIMDKGKQVQKIHEKSSEEKEMSRVQEAIIHLLQTEGSAMTQVEIAAKLDEKDLTVLKALNNIDKKAVKLVVTPIDESGNSSRWEYVKTSRQ
ncbi:hypothetical protein SAMN04487896_0236 [Paenibacillus sp. ov031]|uniref:hypothetical protein n=1 Tax=Paenibacillus sp. ov031 TaxID=1761879 RepID=UPI000911C48F|nr:hypothetical protein [Paenibacillus sp. ov031]SHN52663.1 hypothetical protein SAMN04487896_0236 [Paenibacillus sp. ov031]